MLHEGDKRATNKSTPLLSTYRESYCVFDLGAGKRCTCCGRGGCAGGGVVKQDWRGLAAALLFLTSALCAASWQYVASLRERQLLDIISLGFPPQCAGITSLLQDKCFTPSPTYLLYLMGIGFGAGLAFCLWIWWQPKRCPPLYRLLPRRGRAPVHLAEKRNVGFQARREGVGTAGCGPKGASRSKCSTSSDVLPT